MLLSGFNLVKNKSCGNHEFSDFILCKIKEEQDRRDKKCLGKIPYSAKQKKYLKIHDQDLQEDKENVENDKKLLSTVEIVEPLLLSSKNEEISHVSIETKDGYYLAINDDRDILFLSGKEELTQSNKSLYPDCPDERFFVKHQLENKSVFIQPYLHKGYYIHHIDNNLFVRKLEINWRPPEEYFFKIEVVDVPELDIIDCEMDTTSDIFSTEFNNNKKNEKQLIEFGSPKTPKQSLIFGCFGSRAKKNASNKKTKR
ncbi:hypothetical protein KUTeg_011798 [Tegillarca granosa]|uniref:Uncharacterized protein n=1 Tax=Tegillarca granosa TaxID=220873 RepID=A0ABQ9EXQ4_TEGGR|nr:hypothetical protein KUTeg_011798 [Tegillarca granosa]